MSAPPPSYSESMQGQGYPSGYQPSYGAVNTGAPYPPQGASYPPQGAPYPPQGAPYPPQDPSKGMPSYQPIQGQTTTNVVVQPQAQPVVLVGGCPACRVGVLEDDFTCCGVLCAILFFPLGILCCLAMRQRRCAHCGAVFG